MRTFALLLGFSVALAAWAPPARAQVNDAQRAAARDLFKQGDELQRASRFAEALDKFQRAQQLFSAPTNELRIAECEAALGRLVESTEAFRSVMRTSLPIGAPQAFQEAIDRAKVELAQVEPRVPRLVVQVQPSNAPSMQLQLDGQNVSSALIDEPIPLDPGAHHVAAIATGYEGADQSVVLKEGQTRNLLLSLKPAVDTAAASPVATALSTAPPQPSTSQPASGTPPPPPPIEESDKGAGAPKPSRTGLLVGAHLGLEGIVGVLPVGSGESLATSRVAGSGLAIAFDGAYRFARHWCVGLTIERAWFGAGTQPGASADATLVEVTLGIVANPDKTSFYGQIGLGSRWLAYSGYVDPNFSTNPTSKATGDYNSADFSLGVGLWLPIGRTLRLLPKVTLGLGNFDQPSGQQTGTTYGHSFFMLGLAGFYNLDF